MCGLNKLVSLFWCFKKSEADFLFHMFLTYSNADTYSCYCLFSAKIWLISLHLDLWSFLLYGCFDAQICGMRETLSSLRLSYFLSYPSLWKCVGTFCFQGYILFQLSCCNFYGSGSRSIWNHLVSSCLWLYVAILVWKYKIHIVNKLY